MLKALKFKFGANDQSPPLELAPSHMVIFVGPNNSGKSLVLRELMACIHNGRPSQTPKVLVDVELEPLERSAAEALIAGRKSEAQSAQLAPGQVHLCSYHPVTANHIAHNMNLDAAISWLCGEDAGGQSQALKRIISHYAISLDGGTRLGILDSRPAAGQLQNPTHVLGRIFCDVEIREKIRAIGSRAFGSYLVIDPTSMHNLEVKLSDRPPEDSLEEQSLNERSRSFHSRALPISEASDGVKAYLGLISAIACSDHRIIVIDEPEAFLHPPLAKDLGSEVARTASTRNCSVFVSTHSAHFLMGAIESGVHTDIVRLAYDGASGAARILRSKDLAPMMRDPLLRSTGMLSALFHPAAVVCEGDLDRAAYSELDRRLREVGEPCCQDAMFISAHGKDAVHRLVAPLRQLGIPAAAVVDLDMVQAGQFGELLKSCGLPDGVWQTKRDLAGRISAECERQSIKLKLVGVSGAPEAIRSALEILVAELADWGLFLVPTGELEGWLAELDISAQTKRGWLYRFFEKIGSDPAAENYLRPTDSDVWSFLRSISRWISNRRRLGVT